MSAGPGEGATNTALRTRSQTHFDIRIPPAWALSRASPNWGWTVSPARPARTNIAAAEHEGGPRNGVLTAVEDFLREERCADWKLLKLPVVFGLGVLCAPGKCAPPLALEFAKLEMAIAPLGDLFDLLERNRIALFLTYLRQVSGSVQLQAQYDKLARAYAELEKHSTALQGHGDALQHRYDELLAHSDALLASYHDLQRHAEGVQKAHDNLLQSESSKPPVSQLK